MTAITPAQIQAAQDGDTTAKGLVYEAVRPLLRSIAGEFASNPVEAEELEQEAALSLFVHLDGYKVGSRASLTTYLHPRVRQDVRNSSFSSRATGALDGDSYAEFARAAGKVHQEIREERNAGGDIVRDGAVYDRIKNRLMTLPGNHAWSEERFLAAHELIHQGAQSMEDENEDGDEFGASVVDTAGLGNPEAVVDDSASQAKALRAEKRSLVRELLATLPERQAAVLVFSFGIGQAPGVFVAGLLEESLPEGARQIAGAKAPGHMSLTPGQVTDQDIAELLGTTRANVRQMRKRALAALAAQVAGMEYPASAGQARVSRDEQALLDAIAANDEGTYTRFMDGKGGVDVEFHVINDEGDRVGVYLALSRAVEIGALEGQAVERVVPEAPEAYRYGRLFGRAATQHVPADRLYVAGHDIVQGVDQGAGVVELVVRAVEPVNPEAGVDYTAPLWAVAPLERIDFLGRRAQADRI